MIEAKERGDSVAKIAEEKAVSESAVVRIWRLYRQSGSYTYVVEDEGHPAKTQNQIP